MKKGISLIGLIAMLAFAAVASDGWIKRNFLENTVVDVAAQTDYLSTFVEAIQAGNLAEKLEGEGPYTVFAPTNAAFDKLPAGVLQELLRPENRGKLQEILNNHIIPGKILANEFTDGETATSIGNGELKVQKSGNNLMINSAFITTADIEASNGVVHIVDTVILTRRR